MDTPNDKQPQDWMTLETRQGAVKFPITRTDADAARKLAGSKSDFGRSLSQKFFKYNGWSQAQRAWAHYLIWQAEQPPVEPVVTQGLGGIVDLLDHAAQHLKHPKITFQLPANGPDCPPMTVQLAQCGSASKTPGAVNVTDGRGYGRNTWYGRIDRDGKTTISHPRVLAFLTDFATDPAAREALRAALGHEGHGGGVDEDDAGRPCGCGAAGEEVPE